MKMWSVHLLLSLPVVWANTAWADTPQAPDRAEDVPTNPLQQLNLQKVPFHHQGVFKPEFTSEINLAFSTDSHSELAVYNIILSHAWQPQVAFCELYKTKGQKHE